MNSLSHSDSHVNVESVFELEALEKADAALAILEQLKSCIKDMSSLEDLVDREYRSDIKTIKSRLESLYHVIDEADAPIDTLGNKEAIPRSKIMRMGLNKEIITLYQRGVSIAEIARRFDLSVPTVQSFCRFYDNAKPSQRTAVQRWSIMDTAERMEELGALIYNQLARLTADPNTQVKFVTEQIKLIKQAQEFVQSWKFKDQIERTQMLIKEIFLDELKDSPQIREKVLRRFNELGIRGSLEASQ
jgi:hypothetical protein